MKSKQWLNDRLWLRKQLTLKPEGLYATFLCVLVSHMRGKLHMKTYKLKAAGWRSTPVSGFPNVAIPAERVALLNRMYGSGAAFYYNISAISTLADQEAFIQHYTEAFFRHYDMKTRTWIKTPVVEQDMAREIAARVLDADNAYAVEEVTPAEEVQEAQTA